MSQRIHRNMPSRISFLVAYVFPWPFLLAGITVLGIGLHHVRNAQESENWPTTEGTVTASAVRVATGRSGSANDSPDSPVAYRAKISYDYRVRSESYSGNRVSYGNCGSSDSSLAENLVDRYQKGATVKVFYNPESPKECVLEPGTCPQAYFLPAVGSIFVLVGLGMVIGLPIASRRALRDPRPLTTQAQA